MENAVDKNEIKRLKRERIAKRITEIDVLRGICVLLMIFDHLMYDLWGLMPYIFKDFPILETFWAQAVTFAIDYWTWDVRIWVRRVIVFFFLALTGISCSFSKSNLKRGLILAAVALGVSIGTFVLGEVMGDKDYFISFGILHLISLSIITVSLVELITKNKWVFLGICVVMITAGAFLLKESYASYYGGNFFELYFKQFVGLILLGPDSYSFLFYGGQVFFGVFLGKLLYKERRSLIFKKGYSNNPLTFVGRHSLIVYVAHQLLIPLILALILLIAGYQLNL